MTDQTNASSKLQKPQIAPSAAPAIAVITVDEFHSAIRRSGSSRENAKFICPMCKTAQSAEDLIAAGAGNSFDEVEGFLAFSCVGRWTDAGPPRPIPDGKACNWTLGGLFQLHKLEVETEDGERHRRFTPAGLTATPSPPAGDAS